MRTGSSVAIKEWAVVCEAVRHGRQQILLRKGGIAEGPEGFRPEHDEFWLYPTRFHQSPDDLLEDARELLSAVELRRPPAGNLRIDLYARVKQIDHLTDESQLDRLRGQHVLSDRIVRERFRYRRPGLYVLHVQVWELPEPLILQEDSEYAGCHSWVDLRDERLEQCELEGMRECGPPRGR